MLKKSSPFNAPLSCQNKTIAYYHQQIQQQKRILQHIQAVLPDTLAKQTRHCLIKDKKLLIYTDSAIWATQLRFYSTIILAGITQQSPEPVETIQIKIVTESTGVSPTTTRKAKIPSATTIEAMRNDSLIVRDHQLQQALLKLSATLQRLSGKN
ncbi:MAG: DUF721 domain-containing protein [Methylovulum sp.]|nr:DUF721 domain-containing protein [Methylovulum sp.]